MKIGFIGVGAMAKAIIKGLIASKVVTAGDINVHSAHEKNYVSFSKATGVVSYKSNQTLVEQSDVVVLAVTPEMAKPVLQSVREQLNGKTLISIVGGMSISRLEEIGGYSLKILRALPNINVEIMAGMTALAANEQLDDAAKKQLGDLFQALGEISWQPETAFGIFSALAGSSPAYVDFFIDSLSRVGVKYGLSKAAATKIAAQAVQGSAKMVLQSSQTPFELIDQVSSPGGSTVAGLLAMEEAGFMTAVVKGIDATIQKNNQVD
ncbi:pyrroline-5-carboxylate reductase [Paucilactobacillus hokkaidonensis JCM 18461]|uniref:Pyrroline-5-carboxylate reductase n=2 Tax=Paucilactobacillus hokkaidonensis TaxID=1193095 RepID=A0A0A1GRP5_9LACO|nr:pyrroline-5-carboxylate reductase [Paucilactobacillus hokkaidonensis]BAP84992.1 pyrroline-5-carboxylate reductase [Paucilactobacillus hokkaidonensis JCM 18461]